MRVARDAGSLTQAFEASRDSSDIKQSSCSLARFQLMAFRTTRYHYIPGIRFSAKNQNGWKPCGKDREKQDKWNTTTRATTGCGVTSRRGKAIQITYVLICVVVHFTYPTKKQRTRNICMTRTRQTPRVGGTSCQKDHSENDLINKSEINSSMWQRTYSQYVPVKERVEPI